jgi:MoxR-like ATPase
LSEAASEARAQIDTLIARMGEAIIGQRGVIERLVIGLLANGNLLVEGLPGLAKTRAIKALARNMDADFSRIQFTPDLLPADVTGTEVYHQADGAGAFRFEPGPIFANIVLADEINRAPAKVQSALLEAMEERQVTVAGKTHRMPPLFMVMATQNPVEQEGTYPLPEAQMDRFMLHVLIDYPPIEDEVEVIRLVRGEESAAAERTERPAPPPRSRRRPSSRRGARSPRCTSPPPWSATSPIWSTPRAGPARCRRTSRAGSRSAPAPAPRWRSTRPPAPTPGCAGGITSTRRTCAPSPMTRCATGWA